MSAAVPVQTSRPATGVAKTGHHLYAGFVSGLTSSVLLQPLDLLKTRVQQNGAVSLRASLREVSSVASLWRGTLPSAIRTSVGSALYLTTLNAVRTLAAGRNANKTTGSSSSLPKLGTYANLASGAGVRGLVGLITMPITVIKVRYESSLFAYKSLGEAVRAVWRESGVRGFFAGYGATFARDAPYAGLYVLFYEKGKEALNKLWPAQGRSTTGGAVINSAAALSAAVLASTVTAPFDTVKTRVQLEPARYRNFAHGARLVLADEGFLRLFNGLSLRLTRKAFSACISWCIYEELVRRVPK